MLARMWRKGNPCALWWDCKLVQSLSRTLRFLKKLKVKLPYDPAAPLLDIHPKEMKTNYQRDVHTHHFLQHYSPRPRHGNDRSLSKREGEEDVRQTQMGGDLVYPFLALVLASDDGERAAQEAPT